ncbi:hypothetical protein B0H19DRAFT_1090555 [Mycena capillaripes]|nr:hypothetical protein B0H19DRAFT_1090555 [Mycena capillaripes]
MLSRRVGQRAAAVRACRHVTQASYSNAEQHPHLYHVLGDKVLTMRTMDHITSPLDAFAIVRAVERRFGRVAEYRFYRDAETLNRYQFVAHFAFWDPASYARVPKKGSTKLRVKVPPPITDPASGGVGLTDMVPFLEAQDWTENAAEVDANPEQETPTEGPRVIQFMVDHSAARFQNGIELPGARMGRKRVALAAQFVRWGGFAAKEPVEKLPRITRSDLLFGGAKVDHPHMRHLLGLWKKLTANPYANENTKPTMLSKKPTAANDQSQAAEQRSLATPAREPQNQEQRLEAQTLEAQTLDLGASLNDPSQSAVGNLPPQNTDTSNDDPDPQTTTQQQTLATPASTTLDPPPKTAASPSPAPSSSVSQPPSSPTPTQHQPRPAANVNAKPAPERRNQARAARVVMHKVKPAEPTPAVNASASGPKGKAAQSQTPSQPTNSKGRKPKKDANPAPKVSERPIEVEERAAGIAGRLKGLFGGWR